MHLKPRAAGVPADLVFEGMSHVLCLYNPAIPEARTAFAVSAHGGLFVPFGWECQPVWLAELLTAEAWSQHSFRPSEAAEAGGPAPRATFKSLLQFPVG